MVIIKKTYYQTRVLRLSFLFCLALLYVQAYSQTPDDKVIINHCDETYTFVMKDGKPYVSNTIEREYISLSKLSQTIQPSVFYGNDITVDHASCSGSYKANYKSITPENVFFDDTKICFFHINLDKEGKKVRTTFQRTFKDVKYLARVFFTDDYFIRTKTLTFKIPSSLSDFELVEYNMPTDGSVKVSHIVNDNGRQITYTITNMPAQKQEKMAPSPSKYLPHVIIKGAFKDHHDLYRWAKMMSDVNCDIPGVDSLIASITHGCTSAMDKVCATYRWIQENIHYVAFEAGVSAHQPDRPSEVIRKRYGDCKGMSLLLKTLLCRQGFDARLTDIGTTDIPYRMTELPTLASANHVICTLFANGQSYYLDPTCRFIPASHIPGHIQGCEAMIENGDDCIIQILPHPGHTISKDSLCYHYQLADDHLEGNVVYTCTGDMKDLFMSQLEQIRQGDKQTFLENNLNSDNHTHQVSDVHWEDHHPSSPAAVLKGNVVNRHSIQILDNELYLELNPHNNYFIQKIDTTKRVSDFELPVACTIVRVVEFTLPDDYQVVHIPQGFSLPTRQGLLSCSFIQDGHVIRYEERMQIENPLICLADILSWNEAVSQWTDACNEQVILRKK